MKTGTKYVCDDCEGVEILITIEPDRPDATQHEDIQDACEFCPICGGNLIKVD